MKQNYIILSTLDWNSNWQIPHELVHSLLKDKNRVLYVENTGVRSLMIKDLNRILKRASNFIKSARGFKKENKNLTIFSPIILPYPYNKFSLSINKLIYINNIKKWIEINNLKDTILICFLPSPINLELVKNIKFNKVVYYCLDNLSQGYFDSYKIKNSEKQFIKLSDLNFFTSQKLLNENFIHNKSFLLPAGVKLENFKKERKINKKKNKKVIGYIGAVSNVFDQELVKEISKRFNNYLIHIVGPVFTDISDLEKLENIKFTRQVPHKSLQNYIVNFDIGIIPYKINSYTESVYPCKLNEYLAMGVPVVTTGINELKEKNVFDSKVFSIANNKAEFIKKIEMEINRDTYSKIKLRKNYAKKNSWKSRYQKFSHNIFSFDKKYLEKDVWTDEFINQFKNFKNKIFKTTSVISIIYLMIFHSSIVWRMGDYLRYFKNIEKSDTLVVFSGDGEDSYINNSYQQRVLDAIRYHKLNYYKNIYLSSGKEQTIPETTIIKSILLNYGIDESNIKIQTKYPSSTAKNISYVYKQLKRDNVKKILFLTSPFHSRRSMLIWKNYPDISVLPIKPIDDNYINEKFNLKFKSLKIISYEYLSIIYNYFRGNFN